MSRHLLVCCILMGFVTSLNSLSILVIAPTASTSHHIWAMTMVKELLHRGHHVYLASIHKGDVEDKIAQNFTSIVFDNLMAEKFEDKSYNPTDWIKNTTLEMIYMVHTWGNKVCEDIMKTRGAKKLLETVKNVEFNVIVHDVTTIQCLYGLWEIAKGSPPIVGFVPFGFVPWIKDYIGGSNYPTVRPFSSEPLVRPIGLWQRMWNFFYFTMDDYVRHYHDFPIAQELAERFVGRKIRPLQEIEKNISIVLFNTHPTFEPAIPLPPNAIEVGGIHAQNLQPVEDKRILKFLDEAKDGAVVISLGTNVDWRLFGSEKFQAVVQALSELKQRILWKFPTTESLQLPDNIMAMKWIPQGNVLTHKNVKAIWTHGGLLSTQEAIWQGIPVIGMPFFNDQKPIVELLVDKGVGVHLAFETLSKESVLDAFQKILYNESYASNMKRLSIEFRDRPVPPLDLAVWYIEYAVRHPYGNLASSIRSQSWMEQNLIDVYILLCLLLVMILSAISFTLKMLINFCRSYTSKSKKSKQM